MNAQLAKTENHAAQDVFKMEITEVKVNPYSKRAMESMCACAMCGRPLGWRPSHVAISIGKDASGLAQFLPVEKYGDLMVDPVEYGTFIGSVCAKKLPKEYRVTMNKACKNQDNWA